MIDKLKQIEEKMILELLQKPEVWKTLMVDYHPPVVERCWTQVGNFRILLHFIHKCETKDALFHPHPWPSAMHVLNGKYEMGLGFGEGLVEPEKMCTILLENGGAYYDMTHIDGWHYVRPVEGVCATVMLIGKPWGREEIKSDEPLSPMTEMRKMMILEWFTNYYRNRIQGQKIIDNQHIQKGDWIKFDESVMSAQEKKGMEKFFGKNGFVIANKNGLIDVRFDNDRTQTRSANVILLDSKDKPIKTDSSTENITEIKEEKTVKNSSTDYVDHMRPDLWPDDADDEEI